MHPVPYLFFNGTCREALQVYADIFGAEVSDMMTYGDLPASEDFTVHPDRAHLIMNAAIKWPDGGEIMASDDIHGMSPAMAGNSISMALPTVEEGKAAFDKLAEGGEIGMPYGATFWTPGFGTVTDRFGTRWMIGTTATA